MSEIKLDERWTTTYSDTFYRDNNISRLKTARRDKYDDLMKHLRKRILDEWNINGILKDSISLEDITVEELQKARVGNSIFLIDEEWYIDMFGVDDEHNPFNIDNIIDQQQEYTEIAIKGYKNEIHQSLQKDQEEVKKKKYYVLTVFAKDMEKKKTSWAVKNTLLRDMPEEKRIPAFIWDEFTITRNSLIRWEDWKRVTWIRGMILDNKLIVNTVQYDEEKQYIWFIFQWIQYFVKSKYVSMLKD